MPPTTTLVPRAEPTEASSHSSNSSVFTFLIALLILLCTSAAVVLRAVLLRRRFRRRVQDALDAGILLPSRPIPEQKPTLWEVWVRGANNVHNWDAYKPVSATRVPDNIDFDEKRPPRHTVSLRPPPAGHLMEMLGHAPTLSSVNVRPAHPVADSKSSTVQVAMLISMPMPHPIMPAHNQSSPPSSLKGKEKYPDAHDDPDADTDAFPDVMFGVSTFAVHDP